MNALPRTAALFFTLAVVALSGTVAGPLAGVAHAQPQKQADQLNEEGKAFLRAKKYAEASDKFRQAIVLLPDGRFYYNLCMSLYHEGKLGEALTACRAVAPNGGNETAVKGAQAIMEEHIKPKMREAGFDPDAVATTGGGGGGGGGDTGTGGGGGGGGGDTGGGGGDTGGGGGGDTGTGGGGDGGSGSSGGGGTAQNFTVDPPPSLFTATTPPDHDYTWTLGGQLLGMNTSIGETGRYQAQGQGFRLVGDYMLSPRTKVGAQGYIGATYVGDGDDVVGDDALTIVDVGIAGYKELCRKRACLKPLIGGHIGLLQTDSMAQVSDEAMITFGIRPEIGFEYAVGSRMEHVITASLGLSIYLPVIGKYAFDPADFGLDKSSANGYFGIGYTHRFNTPLGSSPFFTLQ